MIFGDRVKQARQLNGFSQTELADRLHVGQPTIARIESGRMAPSDALVETIGLQTGFPPSFFRQPPDGEFPGPYKLLFRAKAGTTNKEEFRAFRYAETGYRILRHLLSRVQKIPLRLPKYIRLDYTPSDAADLTRYELGLSPDQPIKNIFHLIESGGVVGLTLPVRLKKIDAFHVWTGGTGQTPMIVTSYVTDDGARLRWSVAHEVGHLVLHEHINERMKVIEDEANEFAQQFLLPERAMYDELETPVTLSSVASLKQRWGVSMQALIYRAGSLGIISARQRTYLFQQLSARGWRLREPPNLDVAIERPQSLPQLAKMIYGDPIDAVQLGSDTNLAPRLVESFLYAHGVAGLSTVRETERVLLEETEEASA